MSKAIDITGGEDFKKEVLSSEKPVLVDFWAEWCMPCRMMAPVLEEIASEFKEKIAVAKVNTEKAENQGLAYIFGIQSIPNIKVFKDGKIIHEFLGYRPKEIFEKEIKELLNKLN